MTLIHQPAGNKPNQRLSLVAIGLCLAFLALIALHAAVRAEEMEVAAGLSLIVDRTDDVADAVACDPGVAKDCSLRGAVIKAAFNPGATIHLLHGQTYVLTLDKTVGKDLQSGDLNLIVPMTITVSGALACGIPTFPPCRATIEGEPGWTDRIFAVAANGPVTIENVTLRNGHPDGDGGAIYAESDLTLRNVTIEENRTHRTDRGGGIYVAATSSLTLTFSNVINNSADSGGGIYNLGSLALHSSSVINGAARQGAGIFNGGVLTLVNSTLSGNVASGQGGGIYHQAGTTHAWNVTVAMNDGEGGGIFSAGDAAQVQIDNSILVTNDWPGHGESNCRGPLTSGGYNLLRQPKGCAVVQQSGDLFEFSPNPLSPLALQVGGLWVHPLQNSSLAIEAGNPAGCLDAQGAPLLRDQRGVKRPQGARCDSGAYEWSGLYLDNISPKTMPRGGPTINLTVNGFNFVDGAVVDFAGQLQLATFISSTQLSTLVADSWFMGDNTSRSVSVVNPNNQHSNQRFFYVTTGATLATIAPASALVGSEAFSLTVYGNHFIAGAVVQWNGNPRPTTLMNSTQLVALIGKDDLTAEGTAQVRVLNIAPNGLTKAVPFVIQPPGSNPLPTLLKLTPDRIAVGSAGFTVLIDGANFINESVVDWGGNLRIPSFVTSQQLGVPLLAADLAQASGVQVAVVNPGPGGGKSNVKTFSIKPPSLRLFELTPASVMAGSGALLLDMTGVNITSDLQATNGINDFVTTFIDSQHVQVAIPATVLQTPRQFSLSLHDQADFVTSNSLLFTVRDPDKTAQTIDFAPLADRPLLVGTTPLSATASSNLPVSFTAQTPNTCSASDTLLTLLSYGVCMVAAAQDGNYQFDPAPDVIHSFTITQQPNGQPTKQPQTITFAPLLNQNFGAADFAISATANSMLPVSFASSTPSICTVSGNMVKLLMPGLCTIRASQAGNDEFNPAADVEQSFVVVDPAKQSQTLTFDPLSNMQVGDAPAILNATSNLGLPVEFVSLTPTSCTVADNQVTAKAEGLCTIRASQAGTAQINPAQPVERSFQVLATGSPPGLFNKAIYLPLVRRE